MQGEELIPDPRNRRPGVHPLTVVGWLLFFAGVTLMALVVTFLT